MPLLRGAVASLSKRTVTESVNALSPRACAVSAEVVSQGCDHVQTLEGPITQLIKGTESRQQGRGYLPSHSHEREVESAHKLSLGVEDDIAGLQAPIHCHPPILLRHCAFTSSGRVGPYSRAGDFLAGSVRVKRKRSVSAVLFNARSRLCTSFMHSVCPGASKSVAEA